MTQLSVEAVDLVAVIQPAQSVVLLLMMTVLSELLSWEADANELTLVNLCIHWNRYVYPCHIYT